MNLNEVKLAGRLTRDIELRYSSGGMAIGQIGLAINRTWTKDGEKREETTFVDVTSFGKQAETLAQYLKKGDPVYIAGRLKLDQWTDKQSGKNRSKLSVVAENFQFISGKNDGGRQRQPSRQQELPSNTPDDGEDVSF